MRLPGSLRAWALMILKFKRSSNARSGKARCISEMRSCSSFSRPASRARTASSSGRRLQKNMTPPAPLFQTQIIPIPSQGIGRSRLQNNSWLTKCATNGRAGLTPCLDAVAERPEAFPPQTPPMEFESLTSFPYELWIDTNAPLVGRLGAEWHNRLGAVMAGLGPATAESNAYRRRNSQLMELELP